VVAGIGKKEYTGIVIRVDKVCERKELMMLPDFWFEWEDSIWSEVRGRESTLWGQLFELWVH
jgi:hypothetical protein